MIRYRFSRARLERLIAKESTTWMADAQAKTEAFRNAASYMSVVFLVGLVALYFLPETKGRPMPEDVEPA